jgi:hypothetical protein
MQKPMKIENDELPAQLVKATNAGGRTGDAAKAVANVAPWRGIYVRHSDS